MKDSITIAVLFLDPCSLGIFHSSCTTLQDLQMQGSSFFREENLENFDVRGYCHAKTDVFCVFHGVFFFWRISFT